MRVVRKEKQMKEVYVTIEDYNVCDKCDKKIVKTNWYDAFKFEFIHKTGDEFPEGGSGDVQTMELCQECAVDLVELLRENGYRVNDSSWCW